MASHTPNRLQRIIRARDQLSAIYEPDCLLCEVRCGVARAENKRGACGLAADTPIYRRMLHFGEERELVPSYAVWLSGCNFLCTFCSDLDALRPPLPGSSWSIPALAEAIKTDLTSSRFPIRNLNFVGGDPSISLPYLADLAIALLEEVPDLPELLLNTNGYLTPEALRAAIDIFDIFVVDFKFGNDVCARQIAGPRRYLEALERNLDALATSGRNVWVRHLLMPGHLDCCTVPVLEACTRWPQAKVNVMPAFVAFNEPWAPLTAAEKRLGKELLVESGISLKYWDGRRLAQETTDSASS